MTENPFWQTKTIFELSKDEWESLCDGCGKCCLFQLQDEQSNQLAYTDVACDLFDEERCQCTRYSERSHLVPECMTMDVNNVEECAEFAPPSCAYRLLVENQPLPDWHHLVCGDKNAVHEQGRSVKNRVRHFKDVATENLENYVVNWPLDDES